MKNKYFIFLAIVTIFTAFLIGTAQKTNTVKSKTKLNIGTGNSADYKKINDFMGKDSVHNTSSKYKTLDCKTCHYGEYPTKTDPLLITCPREGMISVYHKPEEGPEIVLLNEISTRYEPVVFSHKLHAQMSEMGESCNGCHHYNTTGPVLPCRNCHSYERKREDITTPDLRAAYHRQCMNCHRQWSYSTGCNNTCHLPKDDKTKQKIEAEIAKLKGKEHPPLETPIKLVYETTYEKGKIVTFFHEEHTKLFSIQCVACHQNNNCIKCHDKEHTFNNHDPERVKAIKVHKTLDEHHKPCFGCHSGEDKQNCKKCHRESEMKPFNHQQTSGWALNRYHISLDCKKCHGNKTPYTKLNNNCTSCHKDFKSGFNHLITGFKLGENHDGLDCDACHKNNNFAVKPVCNDCHENVPKYKLVYNK